MMGPPAGFLCLLILTTLASARIEENADFVSIDDEDEEPIRMIRNDPSEFEGLSLGSGMEDTIKLGVGDGLECPHSCFCEEEDSYISCIGDGQWAPPFLPSWIKRLEIRNFFVPELERLSIHLPNLQEMHLQQCNLSKIHRDAFISLTSLDHLDLSQNQVEFLGPFSLNGLTLLRHLDISSNNLRVLNRPFVPLLSLEHLNLRENKLESLDSSTFSGLQKVQYVNLDGNNIHSVDVAAFQHLGSLAHLILSNNPLSNLVRLNFFGSRLQYIDVSNIGITKVPQSLTQFVRDLRLAKNKIREIHRGDLDSYPYLGLLVLDDNGLEILEEDALGRHEYLARFWINGNRLKNVPQSLPISLKALYMEENLICHLNDSDFSGLINLEQLYLQRNQIVAITTCAFCDLMHLKTLDLQANRISYINDSIFLKLYTLENLDLSQNPLHSLKLNAFEGIRALRVLQVSRIIPNISVSSEVFDPLKSLQILEMHGSPGFVKAVVNNTRLLHSLRSVREINLMHNELSWIRNDFFNFFPKLTMIKLSGNAWNCSSRRQILWLKEKLLSSPISFYRSYSVRCKYPSSLEYKPLLMLNDEDFPPTTRSPTSTLNPTFSTKAIFPTVLESKQELKLVNNFYVKPKSTSTIMDDAAHDLLTSPSYESSMTKLTDAGLNISSETIRVDDIFNSESKDNNTFSSNKYPKIEENEAFDSSDYILNKTEHNLQLSPSVASMQTKTFSPKSNSFIQYSTIPEENKDYISPSIQETTTSSNQVDVSIFSGSQSESTSPSILPREKSDSVFVSKSTVAYDIKVSSSQKMIEKIDTTSSDPSQENPWVFRDGDYGEKSRSVNVHILKKDNSVIMTAGIVSTLFGIAVIIAGFILGRNISKKNRRVHMWKNSCTSFWNGRSGIDGEIIVGIGDNGTGTTRESEGTIGLVTESHHGLNNRLYLLLQRSSDTGISPETLPDPTLDAWPKQGYSIFKSDPRLYS